MLTIQKKADKRVVRAFTHKLADIPGGVTVSAKDFPNSKVLHEGVAIGKDDKGLYHQIKVAVLAADATNETTVYTVKKGHDLTVGKYLMAKPSAKAYAITAIATNDEDDTSDDITIETTLGAALKAGVTLYESGKTGATNSAFTHKPLALVGESYDVQELTNHFVNAVTIGQVREANIPPLGDELKKALPLINFI